MTKASYYDVIRKINVATSYHAQLKMETESVIKRPK
jgi:hypothetical protein